MNYRSDLKVLREGSVEDANLRFTTSRVGMVHRETPSRATSLA